ncbi:MAG: D-glycero-beta-D-manno-heptose 1,7-bisphosphate 7-phosphatase [Gammaproteobacteria bacterium]
MKLVILDRDGVINEDSHWYIKSRDELRPVPGSLPAIATLCRAGYRVLVATNQSGVGRGLLDARALDDIHDFINASLVPLGGRIEAFFACVHVPEDDCDCRKPRPGLLHRIAAHTGLPLAGVPVVGDRARDLDAAIAVGARPILVRTGAGRQTEREFAGSAPETYDDLAAFVDALLAQS